MIIRGTTPTMTFKLPFEAETIENAFVTVQQNKSTVIEKPISACECEGRMLSAKLEQEETLALLPDVNAEINLVVKTLGGDRLETLQPFVKRVVDTSKDGVI